jgi:tetratricopeptide (TPR) repeat protein
MAIKTMELDADFSPTYRLMSLAYTGKGLYDKALEANRQWGERTGNRVKTSIAEAEILALAGKQEEAQRIVDGIGTAELTPNDYRGMSLLHIALGNNDRALQWLERSVEHHEESLCSMNIDHKFDPLRNDPRFDKVLRNVGLI